MKTITKIFNVYKFDELSKRAQEKAIVDFRNDFLIDDSDMENTIKEIAKMMNCEYEIWSSDGIKHYVDFISEDDVDDLRGKRAYAFIVNNFLLPCAKPKTYYKDNIIYCDGRKNKSRKSKIFFGWDDCPFTGYIGDCCFIEAWRKYKKQFDSNSTVGEFIRFVTDCLQDDLTNEYEYYYSNEYIAEILEINNYDFLEDGTLY